MHQLVALHKVWGRDRLYGTGSDSDRMLAATMTSASFQKPIHANLCLASRRYRSGFRIKINRLRIAFYASSQPYIGLDYWQLAMLRVGPKLAA